ncbi:hypothetical protein [Microbulbifer sp. MCCC 1A16149]|uniref:hypothetical protein n=1 Tax=Microbulbifer sp. MCCC 1A16149 TaxID=3411322 RepID=UPI003D0A5817
MANAEVVEGGLLSEQESRRPGPKPGQRHSGQYKSGAEWNGNPLGCYGKMGKTAAQAIQKKAYTLVAEHIDTLDDIAKDDTNPAQARIGAIRELGELSNIKSAIKRSEAESEALTDIKTKSEEVLWRMINQAEVIEGELETDQPDSVSDEHAVESPDT